MHSTPALGQLTDIFPLHRRWSISPIRFRFSALTLGRFVMPVLLAITPVLLFWLAVWLSYPVRLQIVRLMEHTPWLTGLTIVTASGGVLCSWLWHAKVRSYPALLRTLGLPLGWALAVILFSLPLVHQWSLPSDPSVLGGLLPSSDAAQYLRGARQIMLEETIPSWSCRRPLNAALLSARLLLGQVDFRLVLILQATLLGTAGFLLVRVLAWDFGVTASSLVLVLLFAISKEFVFVTLSEALGLTLGALAAAVLWVGVRQRQRLPLCGGLFLLTLALDCRAGAFFMLPMIIVWCSWAWRPAGRWFAWRLASQATLAVLAGFAIQWCLRGAYGLGLGPGHGNFAHTLYGWSVGVSDWQRIYQDYPAVRQMSDAAASAFIYQRACERLRENPWPVLSGLVAGGERFILHLITAIKGWSGFHVALPLRWLWLAGMLLLVVRWLWLRRWIGLPALALWLLATFAFISFWLALACWLLGGWLRLALRPTGASNAMGFLMAALFGVLLTLPLLADGGVRVLAASYPLLLVAVALGIHGCRQLDIACDYRASWPAQRLYAAPLLLGFALVVVALATPAMAGPLTRSQHVQMILEDTDGFVKQAYLLPGSPQLEVLSPESPQATWAPRVRHKHLVRQLELCRAANVPLLEMERLLATGQPFSLLLVYEDDQEVYLVGPPDLPARLASGIQLAGAHHRDSLYRYFVVTNLREP